MTEGRRNYFVMTSALVRKKARVRVVTDLLTPTWLTGDMLDEGVPEPMEYEVKRGHPGDLQPFYDLQYPLMREDLVEALRGSGVDNLQVFGAKLVDRNSGKTHANFRAVNIVGVMSVASAESERSEMSDSELIDGSFESLVVDEERAGGRLLFRLAESLGAVIAHRRVKEFVEPRVPGIEFLDPEDWSG